MIRDTITGQTIDNRLDEALHTELGHDAYLDLVIVLGPVEHRANMIRIAALRETR